MFATIVIVFALLASSANALSTGAASCPEGQAAVGGGHLRPGAQSPTFEEQQFELVVNDAPVMDYLEVTDGFTYTIGVRAVGDTQFRGALIRANGMGVFEAEEGSQVPDVCEGAPAVTHVSNDLKDSLSGSFTVMGLGPILIDATIVVSNNAEESVYSYQQFEIRSVSEDEKVQGLFDPCSICPIATPQLGLPDVVLPTGTVGITKEGTSCGQLQEAAQSGSYSPAVCAIIRLVVSDTCGCVAPVTTDPPTTAPVSSVTDPPVPAPPVPTAAPVVSVVEPTEAPVSDAPVVGVPEPTEAPVTEAPVVGVPVPTEAPVVGVPVPTEAPVVAVPEPTEAPVVGVPLPTEAPVVAVPEPTEAPVVNVTEPVTEPTSAPVATPTTVSTNIAINLGVGEISGEDQDAFSRACIAFLEDKLQGASNITCSIINQSASAARRKLQNETNLVVVSVTAVSDSLDGDSLGEFVVAEINGDKVGFIDGLQTESNSGLFDGLTEESISAEVIEDPVSPTETPVEADSGGLSSGGIAGIVIALIVIAMAVAGLWLAGKRNEPQRELLVEEEEESILVHPPPNPLVVPSDFPKANVASQFAVQAAKGGAGSLLSASSVEGESEVEGYSINAPGSTIDKSASVDVGSVASGALSSLRHNMIARTVIIPPGKLGIVVDTTLEGPVVNQVNESSPVLGLLFAGDIIVAVDDVDTRAMSASAIESLMKKTSDKRRKVTVLSEDASM